MTKIKDLMLVNFQEDMKDVINLEDQSEPEIQYEIDNYIVTNKIAKYISDFIDLYRGRLKETGVWISGFYGSGKSYFGKMLGFILGNPTINGTPFQERFFPRLAGLSDQNILENAVRGTQAINTIVVFLDIAKQNTNNGFAWTLFKNFIKTLDFLDDAFGYMEYGLSLKGQYEQFKKDVKKLTNDEWINIRKNPIQVPKIFREAVTQTIFSDKDYRETKEYYDNRIKNFDPAKLKEELVNYFEKNPAQRIVFIIDETSEAIGQRKINLLDLEGVSEALSDIPNSRAWTISLAQEKFDEMLNNANTDVKQLNKLIDRFKTKIHLSSEEVDTVIRKRLLEKNDNAKKILNKFYSENNGQITNSTNLNAKFQTKTESPEDFVIYYPFHKIHFDLMQSFLFSIHKKAKTGGTERGMIIATHAILRAFAEQEIYKFVTADYIVDGAKKLLESEMERKFNDSVKVLKQSKSGIDGKKLLKTVYFLSESEKVNSSSENITKLYIENLGDYYITKPKIEKALSDLAGANLLIEKSGLYQITSDLEQKLIDEMKSINVELHYKKKRLIESLKSQSLTNTLSKCEYEGNSYSFYLSSDQEDEINSPNNKYIKFKIINIYSQEISDRNSFIETIKFNTQNITDFASIVPAFADFNEIDKLVEEIYRMGVLEDRYKNDDDERIRLIIKDFSLNKTNRQNTLNNLLEKAYKNGTIIYNFKEETLSENDFSSVIKKTQEKIINNTYTDRIKQQISDEVAIKILKEKNTSKLISYYPKEFAFFDQAGNFIGETIRIVDKMITNISGSAVDGEELEKRFLKPPYGYTYGTVLTILAVLFRAGRLSITYNGHTYYDYKDEEIQKLFTKSRDFKKASFKAITSALTSSQKQQIIENLKNFKANDILNKEIGYSINDIELISCLSDFAKHFISEIEGHNNDVQNFDKYFPNHQKHILFLEKFSTKITDANYNTKAEDFLNNFSEFEESIKYIQSITEFIKNKLKNILNFKHFIDEISIEINKLEIVHPSSKIIFDLKTEFYKKFDESILSNYISLEQYFQNIKDEYYKMIKDEHNRMIKNCADLRDKTDTIKKEAAKASSSLNADLINQLDEFQNNIEKRNCGNLKIEYEIKCKSCHFSLNEIIMFNQNIDSQQQRLENYRNQIKLSEPAKSKATPYQPKKYTIKFNREYRVKEYKSHIEGTLNQIKQYNDEDIIEIE